MAIFDLFSKRERARQMAGQEDVFQYESLPPPFRVQVVHLWGDALGTWKRPEHSFVGDSCHHLPNELWRNIFNIFIREKGVFQLTSNQVEDPHSQCCNYALKASTEDVLDLIDLTFRVIDNLKNHDHFQEIEMQVLGLIPPDDAIAELNHRFRENGIGFEFAGGEIIRVDSKFIHAAAVRPALQLLHDAGQGFSGPLQEFMDAHERYRKGEHKDAIVWACKAFESTLKAICTARGWPFDPNKDTAKTLLDKVFANNLAPSYLQQEFTSLRSLLESGVPTMRNRTSGHGQGATPTSIPDHFAAFVLHLTASNIVFLVESHKAMK